MAHGRIKLLDGSKVMFDVTYRMGKPQDLIKIKDEQGCVILANEGHAQYWKWQTFESGPHWQESRKLSKVLTLSL